MTATAKQSSSPQAPWARRLASAGWTPWLAALLLVGLNVGKPLVIDDTAYHAYARQIAEHPGDPYGFEVYWGNAPQPARDVLAPPLLPYWWAGALVLFGDHVAAWKLTLLPFALALAAAAWSLGRRFAPGCEVPLTWLVTLSPAVAPSLNLMLDVPALALSLAALAVFAHAAQRDHTALALAAGLLAGLALETKYSAVVGVAALAVYGLVFDRVRLAALALVAAGAVFIGWESFVSARYGESHFLHHLFDTGDATAEASAAVWAVGGLALLGAVASGPAMLAALAGGRRWLAGGLGIATLVVFAALLVVPAEPEARFTLVPDLTNSPPELWMLAGLGVCVVVCAAPAWWRELRVGGSRGRFLAIWVALEVVGFLFLSPFLALRRMIGIVTALALLALAALAARQPQACRRQAAWVAVFGVALGVVFAAADVFDARARRTGFDDALRQLAARGAPLSEGRVWYVGHWGFQFLAERAGMRPLVAGESHVSAGDWLVTPSAVLAQRAQLPERVRSTQASVEARSRWPWSTLPNAYGGAVAIRRQPARQMQIVLQRIEGDAVAEVPAAR